MDNIKQILWQICGGVQSSILGICTIRNLTSSRSRRPSTSHQASLKQNNDLLKKLFYCFALNGVAFGFATYAFYYLLLPCVKNIVELFGGEQLSDSVWQFLRPTLLSLFNTLWLAPMFLLSRIINLFLFQDIANIAFEMSGRRLKNDQSLATFVADVIYSVTIQTLFLIQIFIIALFPIPLVGNILSFLHLCLLYSLYAFEYKWINMGWPLHKRLTFIDGNWPYFLGFGLPLSLLTMMSTSYIADLCIFSVLFPLYIISGTNSVPIVSEYNYSLHIFLPVIYFMDIFTRSFIQIPVTRRK